MFIYKHFAFSFQQKSKKNVISTWPFNLGKSTKYSNNTREKTTYTYMIYAFLVNRQNVKMLKHFCYFFIKIS